ncbi:hypothetical protein GCM10023231_28960 [Olivibacter ginsenosidimutans]|uniref:DUF4199 domain-containing protein n=1 Tax=Olivibacter ginsenosidimutans TaxID=1176537 RepID=A0ABP9BR42_9SPHI
MEFLVTTITLTLLVGLLISPILLIRFINRTKIKYKFVSYLTIGVFLTALLTIFAWWAYTSDLLLLKHYGYDIDGMNETEFYRKVLPENLDKVKSLETSIMGIGWPLKAIMSFVFYSPYLLIIYGVTYLIGRKTRKAELQKL